METVPHSTTLPTAATTSESLPSTTGCVATTAEHLQGTRRVAMLYEAMFYEAFGFVVKGMSSIRTRRWPRRRR